MNDPAGYTADQLRINLLLAQQHVDDYLQAAPGEEYPAAEFCVECLEKHLLLIEGLSTEALSFFEEKALFGEIGAWAANRRKGLNEMDEQLATSISERARSYRKKLTAMTSECEPCKRLALRFLEKAGEPHVVRGSAV